MMRVTSSSVFELLLWPIEHRIPEFSNRANPRAGEDGRSHNGRRVRIFKSNYDSDRACRVASPQINQNIVALLPAIHEGSSRGLLHALAGKLKLASMLHLTLRVKKNALQDLQKL